MRPDERKDGPAAANLRDMSEIPAALARAFRDLEAAAREVDAFFDPKDAGPPFKFDGKRLSVEAELALLSMHAYLNDVEASRPCESDVFAQMDSVRARLNSSNIAPWWSRAIAAVLDALTDGSVTYGYINEDATGCGPMMTERDAIVRALYTGNHDA